MSGPIRDGRLAGKVAIVTGASRGMGEATARRFAREGASVVLADRRDELGEAVAASMNDEAGDVVAAYVPTDVTSPEAWTALVHHAASRFGRLDVLVNNAGIIRVQPLLDTAPELFHQVLDTNLFSAFLGTKAAALMMVAHGGGSIINVSSPQGIEGRAGMSAYSASKFGVRGFTRTAAIELGPLGIRVNCVIPGPIRTAMTQRKGWTDEQYDEAYGGYPLGRMGWPDEVASLTLFLASDEASYCTGADFVADGGVLAGKPEAR